MAFTKLLARLATDAIDHAPAFDRFPRIDFLRPPHGVGIGFGIHELGRIILPVQQQPAIPGPDRNVGDGVFVAAHVAIIDEMAVEHIELALYLHGETVDGVLNFFGRIIVEMPKPTAEIRGAAHLPEKP